MIYYLKCKDIFDSEPVKSKTSGCLSSCPLKPLLTEPDSKIKMHLRDNKSTKNSNFVVQRFGSITFNPHFIFFYANQEANEIQLVNINSFHTEHKVLENSVSNIYMQTAAISPQGTLFIGGQNKIIEFCFNNLSIIREIPIVGNSDHYFVYNISFSKNGKSIFLTDEGSFYGELLVLNSKNAISEVSGTVGAKSLTAISPDERFLYITDPSGLCTDGTGDTQALPTSKIYQYNINTKSLDVLVDGGLALGLS